MDYRRYLGAMRPFVVLTVLSIASTFAHAQQIKYPDLSIDNPFNDMALKKLHIYIPALPNSIDSQLKSIRKLVYHFEEPPQSTCVFPALCNAQLLNEPTYKVSREIYMDVSFLDEAFSKALASIEYQACSDLSFPNKRRSSLTDVQVTYLADLSAHQRTCGDYPWPAHGSWSIDLATGTGYVVTSVSLKLTEPDVVGLTSTGTIKFELSPPDVHISNMDLLGFINSESIVGQFLIFALELGSFGLDTASFHSIDIGFHKMLNFIHQSRYGISVPYELLSEAEKSGALPDYLYDYEYYFLTAFDYYLDINQTRLTDQLGGIALKISNFALVSESASKDYYNAKRSEMDTLAALSKSSETYITVQNDTLQNISLEKYGMGALSYAIAAANLGVSPKKRLEAGEILTIPTRWEIRTKFGSRMLKPKESFRTFWKNNCRKTSWKEFRKAIPGGYSFLEFALQREKHHPIQIAPACQ